MTLHIDEKVGHASCVPFGASRLMCAPGHGISSHNAQTPQYPARAQASAGIRAQVCSLEEGAAAVTLLQQDDRFVRVRALGEGATARVFEVFDRHNGARCALKQLRNDRTFDARYIAAFKDEFRNLARIGHANLAKIHELLVSGRDIYVLMELIEGVDFVRYVRREEVEAPVLITQAEHDAVAPPVRVGSLSVERLRAALPQLASGVLALHATGRIHCDLKPENVLVDEAGRVVIVDFGLIAMRSYGTTPGPRRGTLHYMAPEQIDGWPLEASDWYAVGVILYVALTGRLPFGGPAHTVDYDKRFGKVLDPRQVALDLPDDLCDLSIQLLSPDPGKRPTGAAIARALCIGEPPELMHMVKAQPLVGRDHHLAELGGALERVRAGETCVAFVHGESGIGKTALVGHFLEDLRRNDQRALVLRGACYRDASVPYKGLDAIMDHVAAYLDGYLPLLGDLDMDALSTMFPVFGHACPRAAPLSNLHPFELRKRAVEAVADLFRRLGSISTIVLWIDDFQWTDEETIDLLAEVLRRSSTQSMLVILGHRSQAAGHSARIAQAREVLPCHYDLHVGPLGRDEVRTVAGAVLGREIDERELHEISGDSTGNPLLLRQLLLARATQLGARASFDDVVAERIARLDETQRAYVELVSLAGRPIDEEVVANILGTTGAGVLAARHVLIAECFVLRADARSRAVECYHDQIRERVLRALPIERAKRHHARLGAELEGRPDAEPEALALHFRGAGDVAKSLLYTEQAGDIAAQALAFERAAKLYESAASSASGDESDRLRVKQGDALSNAGRSLDAAAVFLDVSARKARDIDLRVRAGDELLRAGQLDRGLEILREIARAIGERIPDSDALIQLAVVWNGWKLYRFRVSDAALCRQPTPFQQHQLALCMTVASQLAMVDPPSGALFVRKHLLLARKFGSPADIARGLVYEASFSAHMPKLAPGGPAWSAALVAQSRALLAHVDAPDVVATAFFADATVAYALGRWREARHGFERAIDVMRREVVVGVRWYVAICQSFIAFMRWMEGDVPAIRRHIDEYMEGAAGYLSLETAMAHRVGAMLALCDDDPIGARRLACEMIGKWPAGSWRLQHHFDAVAQTEIDLYEGKLSEAWDRAFLLWKKSAAAGVFQQRFLVPFSRIQRARIALAAGWDDRAARDIRALERWPDPWASAMGRLLRSALCAMRGDQDQARRLLEAGERDMGKWELRLYELAARWRLGNLTHRADMTTFAASELSALGVQNPERMVSILLPWPTSSLPS